ncbi:MAG TPA: hypothetical protein VMA36_02765 [Candidatus Limnocylindria bacterium]|nr:hypothetical protein [Candidatus Limnocylindria bacterium]
MRRDRFVSTAAAAAVSLAAGCTSASRPMAASSAAPAPTNPDLGGVLERFYEGIEDRRWSFAYAMLSPRYARELSRSDFTALYDRYADTDVAIRQTSDRSAVATLTVQERNPGPRRRFEETWRFAWDGERWELDGLRRRELSR